MILSMQRENIMKSILTPKDDAVGSDDNTQSEQNDNVSLNVNVDQFLLQQKQKNLLSLTDPDSDHEDNVDVFKADITVVSNKLVSKQTKDSSSLGRSLMTFIYIN